MADEMVAPSSSEQEQYPSPVRGKGGMIPTPASLDKDARELWNLAFEDALQVKCQSAVNPRQCAIQVAWKAVKEKYGVESEDFVARDKNTLIGLIGKHYGPGPHKGTGTPQEIHGGGGGGQRYTGISGVSGKNMKPITSHENIDPHGTYYRVINDALNREYYATHIGGIFPEQAQGASTKEMLGGDVLLDWNTFEPYLNESWENPANLSSLPTIGLEKWMGVYSADAARVNDVSTAEKMLDILKGQYEVADSAGNVEHRNAIKRLMGVYMDRRKALRNKSFTPLAFQQRREFNRQKRKELAGKGKALPWGGFPIENCGDVRNAVKAIGRAKDRPRTIAHIKLHAKSLGCSHLVPKKWRGGNQGASEKSMAIKEDTAMAENELALAARSAGIDPIALEKRRAVRAKEAKADQTLLDAGYSDFPARRPTGVDSIEWSALPIEERTVGAVVWRRHCLRTYAEAVENAVLEGWKAEKNPHRGSEWIFKSWADTPDGWQLVRGILVRRVDKSDWYMKEVSRGASLSLAIRVAPDEVRR